MAIRKLVTSAASCATLALTIALLPTPLLAQEDAESDSVAAADEAAAPALIVMISVDQFSADLFAEYRSHFTGGLARLADGAVFSNAFQGHAATETCPGHSTLMTGVHPARNGIIANRWHDLDTGRKDVRIYCAEDESVEGSSSRNYQASAVHLLVPTLGDRLQERDPRALNVAVAGKDRAALMMGGHDLDAVYWWGGEGFTSLEGRSLSAETEAINAQISEEVRVGGVPIAAPDFCAPRNRAVQVGNAVQTVGTYAFERPPGAPRFYRTSPHLDSATLSLAHDLVRAHGLGQDDVTDVLSIGLSATDYIGHGFGTEGLEMCINLAELDRNLGAFFAGLDNAGIDYIAVLTADHGGLDLPERAREQAMPQAARVDAELSAEALNARLAETLGLPSDTPPLFADGPFGDFYINLEFDDAQRAAIAVEAMAMIAAHPQVYEVLSAEALMAMPVPTGPVRSWTPAQRARAAFHPDRSGDFVVLLKPAITPIAQPMLGYVATHGSPWDYDRRVPLMFWRSGMAGFEQPGPVLTVDIAPTLAALVDLDVDEGDFDGRCLDLDGGADSSCN